MKARIKQNAWGNWYGYLGNKKVESFSNTPTETMEQQAQVWLAANTDLIPCSIVRVKYISNVTNKEASIRLEQSKIIDKGTHKFISGYKVDKHAEPAAPPKGFDSCMYLIQIGDDVEIIPQLQSKMYGDLHDAK